MFQDLNPLTSTFNSLIMVEAILLRLEFSLENITDNTHNDKKLPLRPLYFQLYL